MGRNLKESPPFSLRSVRRWLNVAEQVATSAALVALLSLIFLSVILRYFFASGITWGEEIARVVFIGMTYVAISRVDLEKVHFRVTLVEDLFPALERYLVLLGAVVQFGLLALLTWLAGSIGLFIRDMGQQLPASGLSAWLFYIPVVTGLALGTLRAGERLVSGILGLRNRSCDSGGPAA
jgi:TRAP-type C4-dicarboxylate transport system permease small subunit